MQETHEKILQIINTAGQARVPELQKQLGISRVAIHKHLKKLLERGLIRKMGNAPLVFYIPAHSDNEAVRNSTKVNMQTFLPESLQSLIEENFLQITPDGELVHGYNGFLYWAAKNKGHQDILPLAQEYENIWNEKEHRKTDMGWFEATQNFHDAFPEVFVDKFLFEEVYSISTFGRTKLARMVMHAKESSNKSLIDQVSLLAKPIIEQVLAYYSIDAVAYIPPTVERPIQFMKELENQLHLPFPQIELVKVKPREGAVQLTQKSIKEVSERVLNARDTIFLKNSQEYPYENVLLIDDAAGSGASFNETARKLKNRGVGSKSIVSFALVGNLNLKKYAVIRQI